MKAVFIYALNCPLSGRTRYIGKAENPRRRFQNHVVHSSTEKSHRANWIRSLLKRGLRPELEVLAQVPESDWESVESDYIAVFRALGFDLVNGTDGGGGRLGYVASAETRAKLSSAGKGRKFSPEALARMRGRKLSLQARENIRLAKLGKKNPFFGKTHTPEFKAKKRAAMLGVKHSPERCAARVGIKQSPETIAKRVATRKKKKILWRQNLLSLLRARSLQ